MAGKNKRKAGKQGGSKDKRQRGGDSGDEGGNGGDMVPASVANAVNRELQEAKEQAIMAENEDFERDNAEDGADPSPGEEDVEGEADEEKPADPYLLADAEYIKKDTRWRNKQRTLVFQSRGVTTRYRHLCEDIKRLLPHHKTEPKFEKKDNLNEINEICELKNCNNVVYFESRRKEHLYMYVARVPEGPTMKFQVKNVHTSGEVRLAGNCLLGSRPLLHFDKIFDEKPQLKLMKSLFTQVFGTPRNHPKSKPFHDHVMGFYWLDKKIWCRHYQIAPETATDIDDPERQQLTEIGPRFVLEPIRFLAGSFHGQTLYLNPGYMTPRAIRVHAKEMMKNPFVSKKVNQEQRIEKINTSRLPEDPTDEAFV